MPIDYNIPLSVTPSAAPSATLGEVFKIQDTLQQRQDQVEERKRKAQQERDMQAAFQQHTRPDGSTDFDGVINSLSGQYPDVAMALREKVVSHRKSAAEARAAELKVENERVTFAANLLKGVTTPEQYAAVLPRVAEVDPEVAEFLGSAFDPTKVQQAIAGGTSMVEYNNRQKEAIDLALSGKVETAVGRVLSLARDQESWEDGLAMAQIFGLPEQTIAVLGAEFSPQAVARAQQLSMTPEQRSVVDDRTAGRKATEARDAEARRHNQATEAAAQQRETRIRAGDSTPAGATTTAPRPDAVALRNADQWRRTELAKLRERLRNEEINQAGFDQEAAWVEEEYQRSIGGGGGGEDPNFRPGDTNDPAFTPQAYSPTFRPGTTGGNRRPTIGDLTTVSTRGAAPEAGQSRLPGRGSSVTPQRTAAPKVGDIYRLPDGRRVRVVGIKNGQAELEVLP